MTDFPNKKQVNVGLSSHQLSIKAELIKVLYQQANTALLGVVATATGIAYIFYNEVPAQFVLSWLAIIYLLSSIRYFSIQKFKSLKRTPLEIIKWGWLFAGFVFLSGLSWGAASVIFFTADKLQLFNILTLIIIAMSVGSLAALSAYPKAYYLFVVSAMLPMIWRYLNIDAGSHHIFGFLLLVFNFALFSIVRVNHKILKSSIVLRFEKDDLVKQLTQQKEKAEQANVAKTKFLAAASHDIRQPLHAMSLFLGALDERLEKDEHKNIVHKIQKSSKALNDLLDSLLDISKLDAGVIQVNTEIFSVSYLFEALKNEFFYLAHEKNLSINFVESKTWLNNDYAIVERIMRNLISNAIRYTRQGGLIVGCRRHQGKVLLVVYDTGIGVPQRSLQIIFNEFHQLHNPERDRSKGLGLGLSIVKRMAKLLDVSIFIKSVPNKGSAFGIILPAFIYQGEQYKAEKIETSDLFFDNKKILVVDDEETVRDSLKLLLQSWHCQVVAVSSGNEAVEFLQKNNFRPDIVLADYRLRNNENGVEAVHKINELYFGESVNAIIITGDTSPIKIAEAGIGGYKVLHKPLLPNKLRLLLAEVLNK